MILRGHRGWRKGGIRSLMVGKKRRTEKGIFAAMLKRTAFGEEESGQEAQEEYGHQLATGEQEWEWE